ncbi:uncharacterized protein TM35_000232290 [Trypanosoma theileri]|uniref:Uncharacterized protein n=1 Tax=Trypanosoma theileri TaxID=67003 RepID=A0A1X0NRT7_9TRYP|nr:uncharacterized protein TM35_000232290 [Trypanosoma theileri]ORC87258.1 hypothetical protein TM35_000232290 [Trypanosoma theileri]
MGAKQSVGETSREEGYLRKPPHRLPPDASLRHATSNVQPFGQVDLTMNSGSRNYLLSGEPQHAQSYTNGYGDRGTMMNEYDYPMAEGSFNYYGSTFGMNGQGFGGYENNYRGEGDFNTFYGNMYDMGGNISNGFEDMQHSNIYTGGDFESVRNPGPLLPHRPSIRLHRTVSFVEDLEASPTGSILQKKGELPGILMKRKDDLNSSTKKKGGKGKGEEVSSTAGISLAPLLISTKKIQRQEDKEKKGEVSSTSGISLAPILVSSNKSHPQQEKEQRPPTPPKPLNTINLSGNHVRTLVTIDSSVIEGSTDNPPLIVQEGANSLSIVNDEDSQLTANEVTLIQEENDIMKSEELKRVKEKFLSGYSVSVICTEGTGIAERAPPLESTSWCMVKKLVNEISERLVEERKEESKQIQLACAVVAIKGKMLADLLKNKPTFENLSVRPSPLFGMRFVGVEYRNINENNTFDSMITHVVDMFRENEEVQGNYIVLSFLLNKRIISTKEEEGDVVVSSLLFIMAGDAVEKVLSVLDGTSTEAKAILDDCVGGGYHSLSIYFSHQQDKYVKKGFKLQREIMVAKHAPPRFGSARTLRKRLGEVVEAAQTRLLNMTNPVEKKNTEKFIENRIALMESLNELLEVVRPRS